MKLSIIIPIFNTEKYLMRCIDSCLNQDIPHNEYEIILINDGSTDNSHSICEEYKEAYSNIKYLKQDNFGPSLSRNIGLKKAEGDYIWFVDSDDWIRSNCLSAALNLCYLNDLCILRIGFKKVNERVENIENEKNKILNEVSSINSGKQFLKSSFVFGAPLYIFKKAFLKKNTLNFYPKIFHEDNEFTPKALYFANRIGKTEMIFYYYLTRTGSTTLSVNPKKCFDLLIVCQSLIKFSMEVEEDIKPYINNVISTSFNSLLAHSMNIDTVSKLKLKEQISLNNEIFRHMIKSKKIKFRIEGLLFSIFPNNVLQTYGFFKNKFSR